MAERNRRVTGWSDERFEAFRQFVDGFVTHSRSIAHRRADVWEPPTDVYETRDAVVIKMSLPGVRACDVRVRIEDGTVTITGFRAATREPGMIAYHQMEIRNGHFERSVVIRRPIDPEAATGEYRDGFLWVRIPKVQAQVHKMCILRIRV